MKKFIFICIVAMGMFSCSTDQTNDANLNEVEALKIESVLKSNGDEDAQKVAYRLLDDKGKLAFWKNRFDLLLAEGQFTFDQIQLIQEFKDRLTVSLFTEITNDEQEYFKNIFVPNFLERAQGKFTFDEIHGIFYSARPFHLLTVAPIDGGGGGGSTRDCNCHKNSLYSCNAGLGCENLTCEISSWGCGVAFLWKCNGVCSIR